ncbi:MAG: diguanylate cyclase/phosphodiesterase (GGDEF & EAL domains) with PAS/PAC sensor(s) [uncultured Solirubrobacteraceae bacterium]|uniref:Diguanylate cyclase/phosphodiesterase (GGDEF & EAL domains) with PAS/PAC sensor(S) n=1 Tax=uncultured Solirubrobacteraceae bacterium TaxID=1162706 RepID=A0A6J4RU96_9ACTN|nr:MAG: diguanylate cyclase/phosphodiesterase (GGDEF & EAL domains) with PAS/PAC sensor(s) [uncultured Solirubrobacteraceae bacterium]
MESITDTRKLRALLRVARVARGEDRSGSLPEIAGLLAQALGFGTVVINLFRPAWDDLEVVAVHGSEAARDQLLGSTVARVEWLTLLDHPEMVDGTLFWRHDPEQGGDPDEDDRIHVPDIPVSSDPEAWHPKDLLLAAMHDSRGELLGILSVDEPISGRRPSETDIEVLTIAAGHVGVSLARSETDRRAADYRRAVQELLRVSASLVRGRSSEEVLDAVCAGIAGALGFGKVAAFLADDDDQVRPHAAFGWPTASDVPVAGFPIAAVEPLVAPERLIEGCALIDSATAERLATSEIPRYRSVNNGIGPLAWNGHWLIVPFRDLDGALIGAIWADEPADRLLPGRERLQALRLFADQAVSAVESAQRLDRMREMAERDALTGLANRRALRAFLRQSTDGRLAMLACDLDHFKSINDRLGHQVGDDVLSRFAEVLEAVARPDDLAFRLGGEEFGLLLTDVDPDVAFAVAERLRESTRSTFSDLPGGLTVSIGVACAGRSANELMADADRALYAAKHSGRDRTVISTDPLAASGGVVTPLRRAS